MVPTAILACVFVFVALRSRRLAELRPAAWALGALIVLDALHHAAVPLAEAWRRGVTLLPWQAWALRLDGVNVAGAWPGVVAGLLHCRRFCWRTALLFALCGVLAVDIARDWPDAWTALRMAPRLAVGALAWATKSAGPAQSEQGPHARLGVPCSMLPNVSPRRGGHGSASLVIGNVIAACQVAAALFLWARWGDVRLLSSSCWLACGWVAWRSTGLMSLR